MHAEHLCCILIFLISSHCLYRRQDNINNLTYFHSTDYQPLSFSHSFFLLIVSVAVRIAVVRNSPPEFIQMKTVRSNRNLMHVLNFEVHIWHPNGFPFFPYTNGLRQTSFSSRIIRYTRTIHVHATQKQ